MLALPDPIKKVSQMRKFYGEINDLLSNIKKRLRETYKSGWSMNVKERVNICHMILIEYWDELEEKELVIIHKYLKETYPYVV